MSGRRNILAERMPLSFPGSLAEFRARAIDNGQLSRAFVYVVLTNPKHEHKGNTVALG
jgi:hypothetical protein